MAVPHRPRTRRLLAALLPVVTGAALVLVSAPPALAISVVERSPVPGEEVVALDTDVTVTFDVPATGVDETTFTLERSAGAVAVPATVSGSGTSWRLDPESDLQPGTTYTARLSSGITDEAMTPLAADSWSFTTDSPPPTDGTRPRVVRRDPAPGSVEVSVGASVTAVFSELVDGVDETTFTLRSGAINVRADVTGDGTRWTLNPLGPLAEDTRYTARLDSEGITDSAGNVFAGTTWSFRTAGGAEEPGEDVRRPRLVNELPRDGATRVSRSTNARAHFSEAVRGVTGRTFRLFDTRRSVFVAAEVFRAGASNRWVLDPVRRLSRLTWHVVRLRGGPNGIRDLAGNRLLTTTWSFRTGR